MIGGEICGLNPGQILEIGLVLDYFTQLYGNGNRKVAHKRGNWFLELDLLEEIDNEAVLLRAYGQGTDRLIDRERETQNHELLMQYNLAPELLARFHNGMLYRFIRGAVTSPADLRRQDIWRAVARRLAEWHAVVPCLPSSRETLSTEIKGSEELGISAPTPSKKDPALQAAIDGVAPGKQAPNVWTVMQKWVYALPTTSEAEKSRQAELQKELTRLVAEFSNRSGLGNNSVSHLHCNSYELCHASSIAQEVTVLRLDALVLIKSLLDQD